MDRPIRAALLIDADNVNLEVVAEVLRRLDDGRRRLVHRRAYGSLQKANEFGPLAQQHAIRFLTTTYAGTNGTDVALAIDAIELALSHPIDEVTLVTSDCDFLPLVARLRELGCRVCGYGQRGKTARDIERDYLCVYDEFSVIDGAPQAGGRAAKAARAVAKAPSRGRPTASEAVAPAPPARPARRKSAAKGAPVRLERGPATTAVPAMPEVSAVPAAETAPVPVAAPRTRGRRGATAQPAGSAPQQPTAAPEAVERAPARGVSDGGGPARGATARAPGALPTAPDDELLRRILEAVPALGDGDAVELGGAAQQLRAAQLLAKTAPSTKLFRKYPERFELTPARQPNKVRYRSP
jgi:hypothetical protein